jgi:hypothetical protein
MFRKLFFTIFLLTILNACTLSTPVITPSAFPSLTLTPFIKPPTPKPPTSTQTPTLTPDPTEIAWNITEQAITEFKLIFPGMCTSYQSDILVSPDGNWLAQNCKYETFQRLQIIEREGETIWDVPYEKIFGDSEKYPFLIDGIYPTHWTNDSHNLFFFSREDNGDPAYRLMSDRKSLYRLDIENGKYDLVRTGMFHFSFSPTDRKITFVEELVSPPVIEVHDVKTGKSDFVKLNVNDKYNQAIVKGWSSDGLKFVVITASGNAYNPEFDDYVSKISLIIVDVADFSQEFILKDTETIYLDVLEWTKDDVLIFQTGYVLYSEPIKIWKYDLKTNTFIGP